MDLPKNIQLPNEIWLKIMNYLKTKDVFGNFALVCKSFNNLTMDLGAIKHIHIANFKTEEDCKRMEKTLQVLKNCYHLRSLSIDECCTVYMISLAIQTFQSSPRLKSLKISNCERNWANMDDNRYYHASNTVEKNSHFVEILKQSAIQLENLELKKACSLSNKEIIKISQIMAPSLKVLKVSVSLMHRIVMTPSEIDELVPKNNQIESIHLDFDVSLLRKYTDIMLQYRGALNRLLGKTSKTLKSIHFPNIDSYPYDNHNRMKEVKLQNLTLCKNLEELVFDLGSHDKQYILGLPKLKKVGLVQDPTKRLNFIWSSSPYLR